MERRSGRGTGESRVPLRPEALLNALRPHCMATMVALEDVIGSKGDRVRLPYAPCPSGPRGWGSPAAEDLPQSSFDSATTYAPLSFHHVLALSEQERTTGRVSLFYAVIQ